MCVCVCVFAYLWLLLTSPCQDSEISVSFVFNLAVHSTAPSLCLQFWELLFRLAISQFSCCFRREAHTTVAFKLHRNSLSDWWNAKKTKRASLVFLNDGMRMCEVIVHIWIWSKSAYLHYFAFAYNPVHKYTSVHVAAVCFIRPPCFSYHVLMISTWSNFSATCITLSMWHTISRQLTWARECQPIGCAITPLSDISIITPPVVTLKPMKSVSKLESLFFCCVCCFSSLQCPCLSNNVNIQSPPPI